MKIVECFLLLLCFALVTAENCGNQEQGDIRIIGTDTPNLIAGRLEICARRRWRAVYDDSWGTREAVIVCTGKGFPAKGAMACRSSCFGSSSLEQGYTNFDSCNNQNRIINCGSIANDGHNPNINAGVVCIRQNNAMTTPCLAACCPGTPFPTSCLITPTQCPTCQETDCTACPSTTCPDCPTSTCPMSTTPPTSTCLPCPMPQTTTPQVCPTTSCPKVTCPTYDTSTFPPTTHGQMDVTPRNSSNSQDSSAGVANSREKEAKQLDVETCTAITASLGVLSAFLLLTLVGVAIVWVWSCHRMKGKSGQRTMVVNLDATMVNPTYDSAIPSQYSAVGPRDTLTSHTPNLTVSLRQDGVEETPYEVPVQNIHGREEGQVDYEVPTPSVTGNHAVISKNNPASYDVLQHN